MVLDIFLLFFTFLVIAFGAMFLWQLAILRVPYVPTPQYIVDAMITEAGLRGTETVYDLGAGDGRLLITAKKRYPGIRAIGCELIPMIWLLGKIRILLSGLKIEWLMCNALHRDVRDADVIFLYVVPHVMKLFGEKFDKELKAGSMVLSHSFRFPDKTPFKAFGVGAHTVWVYRW